MAGVFREKMFNGLVLAVGLESYSVVAGKEIA
jgi:hypothetical protein